MGWKDVSTVKSTQCSPRKPEFNSYCLPPATLLQGDPTPLESMNTSTQVCVHRHTYIHKGFLKIKAFLITFFAYPVSMWMCTARCMGGARHRDTLHLLSHPPGRSLDASYCQSGQSILLMTDREGSLPREACSRTSGGWKHRPAAS